VPVVTMMMMMLYFLHFVLIIRRQKKKKKKVHQVTAAAAFVSNQGNGAAEDGVGNGGAGRFRLLANQVPFTACSQQAWLMP